MHVILIINNDKNKKIQTQQQADNKTKMLGVLRCFSVLGPVDAGNVTLLSLLSLLLRSSSSALADVAVGG